MHDLRAQAAAHRDATSALEASLAQAKADAEAASAKHGKDSAEARAAWDIVSEIEANAGPSEASYAGLDEECLLETMQLCETFDAALDSLQKSINQQS